MQYNTPHLKQENQPGPGQQLQFLGTIYKMSCTILVWQQNANAQVPPPYFGPGMSTGVAHHKPAEIIPHVFFSPAANQGTGLKKQKWRVPQAAPGLRRKVRCAQFYRKMCASTTSYHLYIQPGTTVLIATQVTLNVDH